MKNGLSLTELATEIERQSNAKQDYIVPTSLLTMTDRADLHFDTGAGLTSIPATDLAHDQIAARLDIPRSYYNRLRTNDKALLAQNVNKWLHDKPEKRMVRTLDGKARAFLSDRYERIDNLEIASAALPALMDTGARVESSQITDSRLYIKAVMPKIEGEVRKGDVVQAGVVISNSEVGQGSVLIYPMIFRLVCLNGAIMADSRFSARHLGGKIGTRTDVAHLLSNEALMANDRAIMLKVRDVIRASFDSAVFQQRLELMRDAAKDRLQGDVVEAVEALSKRHTLTDSEGSGILRHLIEGGDLTRYGLHNAVTRHAHDVDSYDRATGLETLGGHILTLRPTEWRTISIAA